MVKNFILGVYRYLSEYSWNVSIMDLFKHEIYYSIVEKYSGFHPLPPRSVVIYSEILEYFVCMVVGLITSRNSVHPYMNSATNCTDVSR